MKQIGIFGGTFDPVHFGHLSLAISILELKRLDEIWWIPTQINPLKDEHPTSPEARLEMLKLALSDIPTFKIIKTEIEKGGPSYTFDTLRYLKDLHPEFAFHLILGDDTISRFMEWKNPEGILELASPLIGARVSPELPPSIPPEMEQKFKKGWLKTPIIEISATEIRDRLKRGLYCGHLLPAKVLDYISHNQLYYYPL